ncbi:MAG: pilus assembly protein PilP [Burkholderiaceae bacterium]
MSRTSSKTNKRIPARAVGAICVLFLGAGCDANVSEIQTWMEEVEASIPPDPTTLREPKKFEPFRYEIVEAVEPFSPTKLAALQDPMQVRAKGGLAPDTSRRREILENFPVEQIEMVGYLRRKATNTALLKVDDTVYQARVGNYAGQNFGVITGIDETQVLLRELVQDATGDWVERETALKLQESSQ